MKRVILVGMLAALGLVAAAPAALARPLTLQYLATTTSEHMVDTPPTASSPDDASPGDQFLFTDRLTSRGRTVGRDGGMCTVISRADLICDVTLVIFGRGTIVLHGLTRDVPVNTVSVLGGTGQFTGRRGTALVRNASSDRVLLTIRLL